MLSGKSFLDLDQESVIKEADGKISAYFGKKSAWDPFQMQAVAQQDQKTTTETAPNTHLHELA